MTPRNPADRPATEPRTDEEWERSGHGAIRRHYPRTGDALRGFLGGDTTTVCDACGVPMTLKDGKWLAEAAQGAAPLAECRCTEPEKWGHDSINHPEGAAPRAEGLDAALLRDAALDVESGYINRPDRTTPTYWRKIAERYNYLASRPSDERVPESEER